MLQTLKLLGPAAESAGKTLQDVWDVVFGRFQLYAQKKRFSNERAFEEFKSSVEQRVIEIPSDSTEPPPAKAGGFGRAAKSRLKCAE